MFLRICSLLLLVSSSLIYAANPTQEQPYQVEIKGIEGQALDKDLLNAMEGSANLFLLIDQPPSSSVSLIRRCRL